MKIKTTAKTMKTKKNKNQMAKTMKTEKNNNQKTKMTNNGEKVLDEKNI